MRAFLFQHKFSLYPSPNSTAWKFNWMFSMSRELWIMATRRVNNNSRSFANLNFQANSNIHNTSKLKLTNLNCLGLSVSVLKSSWYCMWGRGFWTRGEEAHSLHFSLFLLLKGKRQLLLPGSYPWEREKQTDGRVTPTESVLASHLTGQATGHHHVRTSILPHLKTQTFMLDPEKLLIIWCSKNNTSLRVWRSVI